MKLLTFLFINQIKKQQNLPYFIDAKNNSIILSKSHHGSFEKIVFGQVFHYGV